MSAAWASAAGLDLSCPPLLATRTPATPRGSDRSAAAGLPADLTAEALTGFRIVKKPDVLPQTKFNPRAWWQVGSDPVAAVVFSPDGTHVAIASLAGRLLVVDHARLQLTAVFPAYFGGVTCAAWSPDGRYVVAGGHDDLVTIWMPRGAAGGRIVARCQGHASWVNAVQFDPWRCTDRSYRFGSVGEDARLCLWDFNSSTLHKPRSTIRRTATTLSRTASRPASRAALAPLAADPPPPLLVEDVVHPILPKDQVSILEPCVAQPLGNGPLCDLIFREHELVVSHRTGQITIFQRQPS
ncbi:hypothetical protein CXG81DRAFT_15341 [Caulochytrium protostelioides]|uniref:Uncharacterized protein n=1 Tax=Caulochytrium protostelioides TaxID=1555241 RepID=A0A4P9X189_9FUNG|nr:hypothetical protein CXG81DRAFT_15341 [Caulochytrium protostelioides]|eukprot:RKO98862.1 hypothetical protein CXG81DRAFT_15341 [Caulochytrium protostelioides]